MPVTAASRRKCDLTSVRSLSAVVEANVRALSPPSSEDLRHRWLLLAHTLVAADFQLANVTNIQVLRGIGAERSAPAIWSVEFRAKF
jgi:hypothetical protein